MSAERERLPNRRAPEIFSFESMGVRFTGSVSRYPDGRVLGTAFDGSDRSRKHREQIRITRRRRSRIPDPQAPNALTVTDGVEHVGTVVEGIEQDGRFFAFDTNGRKVGECETRAQAMVAIPSRSPS
jgi:hypothetical protein